MKRKINYINWLKQHKDFFIGAGLIFGIILVDEKMISFIVNDSEKADSPLDTFITLPKSEAFGIDKENAIDERTVLVRSFIRNLPNGWKASPEKIAMAKELGIELDKHQTLVDNFERKIK